MLVLLFCLETLLASREGEQTELLNLYRARLNFMLDRHLSSSVVHLKDASLEQYKWLVQHIRNELQSNPEDSALKLKLSLLLVEQSYCQFHFYKHEKAEQSVQEAL